VFLVVMVRAFRLSKYLTGSKDVVAYVTRGKGASEPLEAGVGNVVNGKGDKLQRVFKLVASNASSVWRSLDSLDYMRKVVWRRDRISLWHALG
jgi:hypothetical protein